MDFQKLSCAPISLEVSAQARMSWTIYVSFCARFFAGAYEAAKDLMDKTDIFMDGKCPRNGVRPVQDAASHLINNIDIGKLIAWHTVPAGMSCLAMSCLIEITGSNNLLTYVIQCQHKLEGVICRSG
jgi:hypothetical protein